MRVAVDARELSGKPTGVGRYLRGIVREWLRPDATHGHEILLYAHQPLTAVPFPCRVLPGAGGTLWEQRDLASALRADTVDVLFSPAYSTPLLTRIPRVVALHDISFAAHPEWFRAKEGLRRRVLARRSAAAARAVLTISEFSKREIVSRFRMAPGRVHVIPPGIDAPPAASSADRADAVHLLYVGSIFNRRHIPDLVAAFATLCAGHPDARLHLVGDNRTHPYEDIAALVAGSRAAEAIRWHQYVSDEQLQALYRQARGFVFLSEYEGLGLTPLEALSAGIPPLLLDTAVARESCGSAALYVPLGDRGATVSALERLLYDEPTRRTILREAPAILSRYDWPRAARQTLALLEASA